MSVLDDASRRWRNSMRRKSTSWFENHSILRGSLILSRGAWRIATYRTKKRYTRVEGDKKQHQLAGARAGRGTAAGTRKPTRTTPAKQSGGTSCKTCQRWVPPAESATHQMQCSRPARHPQTDPQAPASTRKPPANRPAKTGVVTPIKTGRILADTTRGETSMSANTNLPSQVRQAMNQSPEAKRVIAAADLISSWDPEGNANDMEEQLLTIQGITTALADAIGSYNMTLLQAGLHHQVVNAIDQLSSEVDNIAVQTRIVHKKVTEIYGGQMDTEDRAGQVLRPVA